MQPRTLLHPTETFGIHFDKLCEALGDSADAFGSDLAKALERIKQYKWDGSLPIRPHGSSGTDFSCPINEEFILVFSRETDRTGEGVPLTVHLHLQTIESVATVE